MDFTFSEDQEALRSAVRDFLARESPASHWRSLLEDERGFSDAVWNRLVELGWTGLLVPQEHGGLGLGLVDLVVVMEEMGRVPFPSPYLSSAVLATRACCALGLDDPLVELAAGRSRGSVAIDEQGHGDVIDRIRTRASRKSGRWRLRGTKPVVIDGHTADWVLVAARTETGLGSFRIEKPAATPLPTLDPTRKIASLELRDTPAEPVGPESDHTRIWRRVVDDGCVALCAELIGSSESANRIAVEYARQRVQFGRPIATFQVIKHKAVDMLHKLELARVGTHYAAWASDADDPVRAEAAAMAKAYVGEAANFIAGECIQIHGGVGFTWDNDAHIHYRKAKQNDLLLGYNGIHRERVAKLVLDAA
ncbi:MAG: acyl-CoA/acyl-ACP dehydrogenase [Deltaproteobacteria bacterium]|nr:MAG: acyl-CoA/acyl-ACP dehydrogenase [Deltaproteobacteria bacterium]